MKQALEAIPPSLRIPLLTLISSVATWGAYQLPIVEELRAPLLAFIAAAFAACAHEARKAEAVERAHVMGAVAEVEARKQPQQYIESAAAKALAVQLAAARSGIRIVSEKKAAKLGAVVQDVLPVVAPDPKRDSKPPKL
jgi:hypothetical protein